MGSNFSIGERLEAFITALDVKKKDFAERLNLPQSHLSRYIGSEGKLPKDELVQKIAAMGLNVHWWVTGEGSMYANNEAGKALRKKSQGIGKEHEPELLGHLSDMPGVNQRIVNFDDSELEMLESLITKIKGQPNANSEGT